MSFSRRSTARSCCLDRSGGTWVQYSTSWPGARNARSKKVIYDARPCAYPDIDPAEVFGGGGYWVFEREELDLDCAERGTQATQFPGPQILGEGILCFDRRAGRGDDPRARHLMTSQLSSRNPL